MENKHNVDSKVFIVPTVLTLFLWIILFLPAGSLKFWEGWIFWASFSLITFFITFYFITKNPDFLLKRGKAQKKDSSNKSPAFFKLYYIGFILPGIDFRFNWSNEPAWLAVISSIIALAAYIFIFLVFKQNSYASAVIEVENKQQVITTGPYSIVRHPMYLGMALISLFMPLALGSYWSIIPMLFIFPITILRIKNEEELLLKELTGYKDYCENTRYRLIPFVW